MITVNSLLHKKLDKFIRSSLLSSLRNKLNAETDHGRKMIETLGTFHNKFNFMQGSLPSSKVHLALSFYES